jgi:prepilin signal peptidase PulO-like enzyme (type II secretory pathway)
VLKPVWLIAAISLAVGCAIGFVDSRPTWDDTGITAGSIFLASLVLSAARPRSAWLAGLLIGVPVLAFNVALHGGFASAIAVVIALAGAGIGYVIGRAAGLDEPDGRGDQRRETRWR